MRYYYDKEFGGNVCEPNCVADYLFYIWAIGHDYDGYETVEGLKSLVDELVDYANNARELLDKGEYYSEENPAPEPKTNYERIKAMSVDEMTDVICECMDRCTDDLNGYEAVLAWLESETEDNDK